MTDRTGLGKVTEAVIPGPDSSSRLNLNTEKITRLMAGDLMAHPILAGAVHHFHALFLRPCP